MKTLIYPSRFLFFFSLMLLSVAARSQSAELKDQIETLIRKPQPTAKIFIDKATGYLEIQYKQNDKDPNVKIPYPSVTCSMLEDNATGKYSIKFSCPEGQKCIAINQGKSGNIYSGLCTWGPYNQEDAHQFIALIYQLQSRTIKR